MHEINVLTQNEAIGACHATTSTSHSILVAVAAPMASFWVRMVTSCVNIKRGILKLIPDSSFKSVHFNLLFLQGKPQKSRRNQTGRAEEAKFSKLVENYKHKLFNKEGSGQALKKSKWFEEG